MHNGLDDNDNLQRNGASEAADISTINSNDYGTPLDTQQSNQNSDSELEHHHNHNDGPPTKKRKLTDSITPQSSTPRPVSPPWKRIAVEGPTSFVEGGRRKSSRTNVIPLELQPPSSKRQTRAAIQQPTPTIKSKYGGATIQKSSSLTSASAQPQSNGKHPLSSAGRPSGQAISKSPTKPQKANGVNSNGVGECDSPAKRSHKKKFRTEPPKSPTPPREPSSPLARRRVGRPRKYPLDITPSQTSQTIEKATTNGWHRSADEEEDEEEDNEQEDDNEEDELDEDIPIDPNFKPQRLKFNVRMPTVTIQNPLHVVPPRKFSSFREWLENDDPLEGSDSKSLTHKEARKEARLRRRILEAAQPGGILSAERCSTYVPDPQEEPPQQYAHQDHLIAHAVYFRKLMNKEHRDHVAAARKLAHLAAATWRYNREAKAAKEDRDDVTEQAHAEYEQCMADLVRKFDMLKAEVERYRMMKWEEEQQAIDKKALNVALEQSTKLLEKRRRRNSSGASTSAGDDEDDHESNGNSYSDADSEPDSEEEQNMSSGHSESEEEPQQQAEDGDDLLTVEEIRRKYANLPVENLDRPPEEGPGDPMTPGQDEKGIARDIKGEQSSTKPLLIRADKYGGSSSPAYPSEMDEDMLNESDQSTDMDDDMGDSDEGSEDDEKGDEDDEDNDNSQTDEEEIGLMGFFSKKELQAAPPAVEVKVEPVTDTGGLSDEETEEVSLIPDVTQVPTPAASSSEAPSIEARKESKELDVSHSTPSTTAVSSDVVAIDSTASVHKPSPLANLTDLNQDRDTDTQSLPATPVSSKPLKTQIPSLLRATLREYQHYGLDWLAGLYANGTNGILADEMGLGKTIQTIALLAHLAEEHQVWGPHLIVVPTSVMLNWEMEFKKFLPGFKILTYYGTQEERKQKRKGWLDNDKWHVCITSYQLVLQDQQTFKRRAWHYLVLDEAHNIKNFRSQRWQALLTFRTRARLLLTGTPLQNNLQELWSLLFFLMPSDSTETGIAGFADRETFANWFKKPVDQILEQGREVMDDESRETVKRLHGVLRPYLLRRLKADVEKQMPGKYEHVVYCKLSKRQRYLYDGFMSRSQTRETLAHGNYLSIINCLMQLRKVCNHPDLFETRQIVTSFAMPKSAVADYEIKELLVRRRLLHVDDMRKVDLEVVNLLPGANGPISALETIQNCRLGALGRLRQLANEQYGRVVPNMPYNGSSVDKTLAYMENNARSSALDHLRHCAYLTSLRSQRRPLFSYTLMERLDMNLLRLPFQPRPKRRSHLSNWFTSISPAMEEMVLTLPRRSDAMQPFIQRFGCITPTVVASDLNALALTEPGIKQIRQAQQIASGDSFHEARMRLSIAFPDKRLLQYDCGKLQRLDALLRTLQAGGHRALIFTQMTKVLDILEQFLNIHGHRYLRLDGATKIEQRQILTERFNNDSRIPVFILSSRSGGLGINLTGADTVIFYDLDWNPAMDKQCQDRCHRIGQTRDVHIYRFVSEYTIEANILRKANQKRMLDDVVIQEGDFTTDYFTKPISKDVLDDDVAMHEGDAEASAAMDRVLGAGNSNGKLAGKIFEQAEDKEDIDAAKNAEKEMVHTDDADFDEKTASGGVGTPKTPGTGQMTPGGGGATGLAVPVDALDGLRKGKPMASWAAEEMLHAEAVVPRTEMSATVFAEKEGVGVDHYLVEFWEWEMRDVPVVGVAERKKKAKKGSEHRVRRVR